MCYGLWGFETRKHFFLGIKNIIVPLLFPGKFRVKFMFPKFKIDSLYPHICFYSGENDSREKDTFLAFSLNLTPIPPTTKPMFAGFILAKRFPVALTVTGAGSYYRTTDQVCNQPV